jgi:hypothetical protein
MADKGASRRISISAPTTIATSALDELRHPLGTEGAHHSADSHLVSGVGSAIEVAQRSF